MCLVAIKAAVQAERPVRAFLIVALVMTALIVIAVSSLREISLRQVVLYQGSYPVSEGLSGLEPGDIIIVNLFENSLVPRPATTCLSDFYANTPYDILHREFTVSVSPRVTYGNRGAGDPTFDSTLVFDLSAISPVDYLSTAFSGDPSCEVALSQLAGSDCLLVVRSVVRIDDVSVGFDTSERCQLINASVDTTVMNSLAAADSFDAALGVSLFERIWTSVTMPLVQFQISD